MQTVGVKKEVPREFAEADSHLSPPPTMKLSAAEVSPEHLVQRISRLEEDIRMQYTMIGIIMFPLAVLALLGAAPV